MPKKNLQNLKNMPNKKIYVSGFDDAQLVITLNLITQYCKRNNITDIILDTDVNNVSKFLKKTKEYKKFESKFNIIKFKKIKKNNFINLFFFLILNFFKIIKISINLNRDKLLEKKLNWFDCQINHSIWDSCYLFQNENKLTPSLLSKLYYSTVIFSHIFYAKILSSLNVKTVFMGHLVYASKAKIAQFRKDKIRIIGHTSESYFELKNHKDMMWMIIDKNHINYLNKNLLNIYSNKYWKQRLLGYGTGEDTRVASKSKIKLKKDQYKNIMMLHIFKDSPFNYIDRNRIFSDYYEWVEKTLEILCNSDETWVVRPHPNAKRWGENSEKIFWLIHKKVCSKTGKEPNILFEKKRVSNLEIFKNAKKILTFSGTPHIEAMCFGLKSIIISDVTLSAISKNLVLKPKNLKEYENLILNNDNLKMFKATNKENSFAKKILFITERTLSFQKELNLRLIYRNDKKRKLISNFKNSLIKLRNKNTMLKLLNSFNYLDTRFKRTFSFDYLKLIKKKYRV